jgi:hypothetical protein
VSLPPMIGPVCVFLVVLQGAAGDDENDADPDDSSNAAAVRRSSSDAVDQLARITVYCETGTIATDRVLPHDPCTIRHVFRKYVTSLDVVERCLRRPDEFPNSSSSTDIDWDVTLNSSNQVDDEDCRQEERSGEPAFNSVQKKVERLDADLAMLRGRREKIVQHIASLEKKGGPPVKEHSAALSLHPDGSISQISNSTTPTTAAASAAAGLEMQFSLAATAMKHVDRCLHDINRLGKLVHCVATSGTATIFLYGRGGVAFTPNLNRTLYQKLSQLRESRSHASRPAYVSLGSRDRYFVAFHDGSLSYKGPKGLDKVMKSLTKPPRTLTFGRTYDTFFVVLNDGTWTYQGRAIPSELEDQLAYYQRESLALVCCSLGPSGEWFVRSENGDVTWGHVSDELDDAIQDLLDHERAIRILDFGENGSYFISYD